MDRYICNTITVNIFIIELRNATTSPTFLQQQMLSTFLHQHISPIHRYSNLFVFIVLSFQSCIPLFPLPIIHPICRLQPLITHSFSKRLFCQRCWQRVNHDLFPGLHHLSVFFGGRLCSSSFLRFPFKLFLFFSLFEPISIRMCMTVNEYFLFLRDIFSCLSVVNQGHTSVRPSTSLHPPLFSLSLSQTKN